MTDQELTARHLAGAASSAPCGYAPCRRGPLRPFRPGFTPRTSMPCDPGRGRRALRNAGPSGARCASFPERNLSRFLHAGRTPFLRPAIPWRGRSRQPGTEGMPPGLRAGRLSAGPALREERKAACRSAGRTPEEKGHLFDGWGSLPQALCEAGRICPAADGKVFRRCPGFLPMEENAARRDALPLLFPLRPA